MTVYRVSIWTSIEVEADDKESAIHEAVQLLPLQRRRNMDFEVTELDQDEPEDQA